MTDHGSIPNTPSALPVIGHLLPLTRNPQKFVRSLPEYGDLVQIRIGPAAAVVVCDPGLTHHVLRNDRTFDKGGPLYTRVKEMIGVGLLTSSHDQHRQRRRLVQPAFHVNRMPGYAQMMATEAMAVINSWQSGQVIDVTTEMTAITSRVLTATMLANAIPVPDLQQALDDLTALVTGLYRRILIPRSLERLPFPGNRTYQRARTRLRRTIDTVLAERHTSKPTTTTYSPHCLLARVPPPVTTKAAA